MHILLIILYTFFFGVTAYAQTIDSEERVVSLHSNIVVNADNSIDVTETIVYDTGTLDRHGIYRDIYPYSSQNRQISIENVNVRDKYGVAYPFEQMRSGKYVRIKIGDPDVTFRGKKTYVLSYRATRALAQFDHIDELYWNVVGNAWNIPVFDATAEVMLPGGVEAVQTACYFGEASQSKRCQIFHSADGAYIVMPSVTVLPGEDLTIAIGFEKGILAAYTFTDNADFFLYVAYGVGILFPLFTLIFSLRHWYVHGRDPKGRGIIVTQYDVPDNLTPLEVGVIVDQHTAITNISAELIYLAVRGYLRIQETTPTTPSIMKKTDYELVQLRAPDDALSVFDQELLRKLFVDGKTTVIVSSLKNNFHKKVADVMRTMTLGMLEKGYYKNLGSMRQGKKRILGYIFGAIWVAIFLVILISSTISVAAAIPVAIGVALSVLIYGIITQFTPAKTTKGVETREYILGLKEYLRIAEKDRLQFHHAPEKKPEVFEKLLPYAMVLGVVDIWAKEFADVYTETPSWYIGTAPRMSRLAFVHSLTNFSTMTSTVMNSTTSGSAGGGFSGGGGGGGGGGGW